MQFEDKSQAGCSEAARRGHRGVRRLWRARNEMTDSELRLQRLTDEIQSTSRRLNALEEVMIPRLERERDSIELALDERERAEHYRLMRAKKLIEHKRAGSG